MPIDLLGLVCILPRSFGASYGIRGEFTSCAVSTVYLVMAASELLNYSSGVSLFITLFAGSGEVLVTTEKSPIKRLLPPLCLMLKFVTVSAAY